MSMLGNSTFTGVESRASQLSYLDVADLNVLSASGTIGVLQDLHVLNELFVGPGPFSLFGAAGTIQATRLVDDTSGLIINTPVGNLTVTANSNLDFTSDTGNLGIGTGPGNGDVTIQPTAGNVTLDTDATASISIGGTSASLTLGKTGGRIGFLGAGAALQQGPIVIPGGRPTIGGNNTLIISILTACRNYGIIAPP